MDVQSHSPARTGAGLCRQPPWSIPPPCLPFPNPIPATIVLNHQEKQSGTLHSADPATPTGTQTCRSCTTLTHSLCMLVLRLNQHLLLLSDCFLPQKFSCPLSTGPQTDLVRMVAVPRQSSPAAAGRSKYTEHPHLASLVTPSHAARAVVHASVFQFARSLPNKF